MDNSVSTNDHFQKDLIPNIWLPRAKSEPMVFGGWIEVGTMGIAF